MSLWLKRNGFSGEDYSVVCRDGDQEKDVGRIYWAESGVPAETPWFWGVDFFERWCRVPPHQGFAESREAAMAALKRCWESQIERQTPHRPVMPSGTRPISTDRRPRGRR